MVHAPANARAMGINTVKSKVENTDEQTEREITMQVTVLVIKAKLGVFLVKSLTIGCKRIFTYSSAVRVDKPARIARMKTQN